MSKSSTIWKWVAIAIIWVVKRSGTEWDDDLLQALVVEAQNGKAKSHTLSN